MKKILLLIISVIFIMIMALGIVGCNSTGTTIDYYLQKAGYGVPDKVLIAKNGYSSNLEEVKDEEAVKTLYGFFSFVECEKVSFEQFQEWEYYLSSGIWVEFVYEEKVIIFDVLENGAASYADETNCYKTKENAIDFAALTKFIEDLGINI